MTIAICNSDEEIQACHTVMSQLRPQVKAEPFVERVRLQQREGYQLAAVKDPEGKVTAVAGFRMGTFLAWGRVLYVDDLVTDEKCRSAGHGNTLIAWLLRYAAAHGCEQLHLDSGVQRFDAHRFYLRQRMAITAHHFAMPVGENARLG